MPFCPKCRLEYLEGVTTCVHCQVELVDTLTVTKPKYPDKAENLVTLAIYKNSFEAQLNRAILQNEGIPCLMDNDINLFTISPVTLKVKEKDLERAKELLEAPQESIPELEDEPQVEKAVESSISCPICGSSTRVSGVSAFLFSGKKWKCNNCQHEWKETRKKREDET